MNPTAQRDPDAALTHALEHRPAPAVPDDFAARVVAALPPQRAPGLAARTARRFPSLTAGRVTGLAAALVLAVALFVIAPHARASFSSFAFDLELLLLVQLGAVAWFLTPLRKL